MASAAALGAVGRGFKSLYSEYKSKPRYFEAYFVFLKAIMDLSHWFFWDPNPIAFYIPVINVPIFIYALFFVAGFILSYYLLIPIFARALDGDKKLAAKLVDKLVWFVMAGTIVGARLGHVLFYDFERYLKNPLSILNTREGGLASHGGTVGVMIALFFFQRYVLRKCSKISFVALLDMLVIPAALAGCFIRIGNFFNQEITGIPSNLPWAIIFGHAADGSAPVPRHPAQLYEALSLILTFALLWTLWYFKGKTLKEGFVSGFFFVTIFTSRLLIEFIKTPQHAIIDQSYLQMGQVLSIPFILLGLSLMVYSCFQKNSNGQLPASY